MVFSISVRRKTHLRNVFMVTDPQLKPKSLTLLWANLPNHSISDMILQGIEALANRRESVRLSREKMWIKRVHTIDPHAWSQHSGREWLISPFFLSPQKLFTFILHLFCLLVYHNHFLQHKLLVPLFTFNLLCVVTGPAPDSAFSIFFFCVRFTPD